MMHLQDRQWTAEQEASTYATAEDLCKIFSEQMDNLHLLSFLLTANEEKAQKCIVSCIAECGKGTPVLRHWARAWTRRTIIEKAIRLISPRPQDYCSPQSEQDGEDQTKHEHDPVILSVLGLADFERFVTVMSVFEDFSDHDCSVLLHCSEEHIRNARALALDTLQTRASNTSAKAFAS